MRAAALVVVATACGEVTAPVAEECAFIADGLCWVDLEFGHEVTAVASTSWGVVVGTGGHGVHRFDAGRWHAMGLEGVTVSSLLFVPGDVPMLLAGLEWRMEPMPGSTLLATTDPGGSWHPRDGGLSYFAQEEWWRSVPVLAADPADPSRLFWGGHGFTALSEDAGLTWASPGYSQPPMNKAGSSSVRGRASGAPSRIRGPADGPRPCRLRAPRDRRSHTAKLW